MKIISLLSKLLILKIVMVYSENTGTDQPAVAKSRFSHNEALLFAIKKFSVIFFSIFFSAFL